MFDIYPLLLLIVTHLNFKTSQQHHRLKDLGPVVIFSTSKIYHDKTPPRPSMIHSSANDVFSGSSKKPTTMDDDAQECVRATMMTDEVLSVLRQSSHSFVAWKPLKVLVIAALQHFLSLLAIATINTEAKTIRLFQIQFKFKFKFEHHDVSPILRCRSHVPGAAYDNHCVRASY
jgi:hypothetical protein